MLTSFCHNRLGQIVDNDTPHPGPFLKILKPRNYSSKITFSFDHREAGSTLPLLS